MTMLNKHHLRLSAALVLLVAAMCISADSAVSASNDMLDMLPADTLFVIKANNLDYALGALDQFLTGVSPVPMGTSMMLRMKLGELFGSPELAGINTAGNFAIFGKASEIAALPGQPQSIFIAVAMPITDYKKFIEGNPNCGGADTRKISKLLSMDKSMIQAGQYALICISGSDDELIKIAEKLCSDGEAKLAAMLDKTEKQNAAKEPFWAYCNMEQVNKNFGPTINSKFQETKSMMQTMASQNPQMGNSIAAMDVYFDTFNCMLSSSKSVSATLNPSAETLKAQFIVTALPTTQLAEMYQTNTAPKENFTHYLNDAAMMNVILNASPAMTKAMNSFAYEMMMAMPQNDPNSTEIKTIIDSIIETTSGSMAASIVPGSKPGQFFNITTITKIKDGEKIQTAITAMVELSQKDLLNSPDMKINIQLDKNISKYKNTNINSLKYTFETPDNDSPEAQMMKLMFADGLQAKYAIVKNLSLFTMGADNDATINSLIDKTILPSNTTPEEIKKAFSLIAGSENADLFVTFNMLRIMKAAMMFSPVPLPPMPDVPTTNNIVLAAKADNGQMKLDIAIPKEHLKEIMTMIQTMQMQSMQQSPGMSATENDANEQ